MELTRLMYLYWDTRGGWSDLYWGDRPRGSGPRWDLAGREWPERSAHANPNGSSLEKKRRKISGGKLDFCQNVGTYSLYRFLYQVKSIYLKWVPINSPKLWAHIYRCYFCSHGKSWTSTKFQKSSVDPLTTVCRSNTQVKISLPVTRSQTRIRASAMPEMTQESFEEISREVVSTPGFHFLNRVPLWRSYTTMKLQPGSSTSYENNIPNKLNHSKQSIPSNCSTSLTTYMKIKLNSVTLILSCVSEIEIQIIRTHKENWGNKV